MDVLQTGKVFVAPSRPRQTMTETSSFRARRFSSTHSTPPKARKASSVSSTFATRAWPLAVVAEARGLEDAGEEFRRERRDVGFGRDARVGRDRHAGALDEGLLDVAVLRRGDGVGGGRRAKARVGEGTQARGRDVFEFGRDGAHGLREVQAPRRRRSGRQSADATSPAGRWRRVLTATW